MSIEQDIRTIITNAVVGFDNNLMKNDSLFIDVGLDSLDLATVLLEVQEKFGAELPEGQEDDFDTLGKLISFVENSIND